MEPLAGRENTEGGSGASKRPKSSEGLAKRSPAADKAEAVEKDKATNMRREIDVTIQVRVRSVHRRTPPPVTRRDERQEVLRAELLEIVNTANARELKKLHTIGDKRARLIMEAREQQLFGTVRTAHYAAHCSAAQRGTQRTDAAAARSEQLEALERIGLSDKMVGEFVSRNLADLLFRKSATSA